MKEKLSRENSVLIVIGYSGNDEHINKILKDCEFKFGARLRWFILTMPAQQRFAVRH